MNKSLGRRPLIRLISYVLTITVFLSIAAFAGYNRAAFFRTRLEYAYQQAFDDLNAYIHNIDITLQKGKYVGTAQQMIMLSARLYKESSGAKASLGQLPVSELRLENTNKFISQVGDFAVSVSRNVAHDEKITENEAQTIDDLSNYAKTVAEHMSDISDELEAGSYRISDVARAVDKKENDAQSVSGAGFQSIENGFSDFPVLIYDGPFSDHILQMTPKFLADKKEISQAEARRIAAEFCGIDEKTLQPDNDQGGSLEAYCFQALELNVAVTKKGGFVEYMINSRNVGMEQISLGEAVQRARDFLAQKKVAADFRDTYFEVSNGICTVVFAGLDGGYTVYPDLIKAGVAMDNGQIVNINTTGFLMNHTERNSAAPVITEEDAKAVLNPKLAVKSVRLAIIPSPGLSELHCYEFLCEGENGDKILVYVNAQNKREEQILILIESEQGTLTM